MMMMLIPIRQPAWVDVDPVDQDVTAQSFTQPSVPLMMI